jgi:hypothetical protein
LKEQAPPSAYAEFNTSVDDWNGRCQNSQFLHSYGETIDAELARSEPQIQADVARTLRQWAPAPALAVPDSAPPAQPSDDLSTWQPPPTEPVDTSAEDENSGE